MEKILADAERYARIKENSRKYYHDHVSEISEMRKAKYRADHPNPRPRGRPRKDLNVILSDKSNAPAHLCDSV